MTQKSNKLKEYKSQFIEPYNFTISSNKHYIYRYFKNFKRLKAFLENGIFMSNGSKFDDGLECVDKETITKVKKLYNSLELWEEYNQHVTPAYLEGYKNNAQQNLMEISKS